MVVSLGFCLALLLPLVVVTAASYRPRPWTQAGFFTHRFLPTTGGQHNWPAQRSYQPSWHVADMGTMYKRNSIAKKTPAKECLDEGEVCLFSAGLLGGAVKLQCCPGSSCVFSGRSFQCLPDNDDYSDYGLLKRELDGENR
jgi:hypothetical protein